LLSVEGRVSHVDLAYGEVPSRCAHVRFRRAACDVVLRSQERSQLLRYVVRGAVARELFARYSQTQAEAASVRLQRRVRQTQAYQLLLLMHKRAVAARKQVAMARRVLRAKAAWHSIRGTFNMRAHNAIRKDVPRKHMPLNPRFRSRGYFFPLGVRLC
jgi:hypothetical protein